MTVLVVDEHEDIRTVVGDILDDAGYAVIEARNISEAKSLIEAAVEPMILVVGNARVPDLPGLEYFTSVVTGTEMRHAFIYLTTLPDHARRPALVQVLTQLESSTVAKPFETLSLLAVIAAAETRLK